MFSLLVNIDEECDWKKSNEMDFEIVVVISLGYKFEISNWLGLAIWEVVCDEVAVHGESKVCFNNGCANVEKIVIDFRPESCKPHVNVATE